MIWNEQEIGKIPVLFSASGAPWFVAIPGHLVILDIGLGSFIPDPGYGNIAHLADLQYLAAVDTSWRAFFMSRQLKFLLHAWLLKQWGFFVPDGLHSKMGKKVKWGYHAPDRPNFTARDTDGQTFVVVEKLGSSLHVLIFGKSNFFAGLKKWHEKKQPDVSPVGQIVNDFIVWLQFPLVLGKRIYDGQFFVDDQIVVHIFAEKISGTAQQSGSDYDAVPILKCVRVAIANRAGFSDYLFADIKRLYDFHVVVKIIDGVFDILIGKVSAIFAMHVVGYFVHHLRTQVDFPVPLLQQLFYLKTFVSLLLILWFQDFVKPDIGVDKAAIFHGTDFWLRDRIFPLSCPIPHHLNFSFFVPLIVFGKQARPL